MRTIAWIVAILLRATLAGAQTSAPDPKWDLNISAGLFNARPEEREARNTYDHWYSEGRYAIGVGYYWTENFKTEIEFAHTPEGSRYVQNFVNIPGTGQVYPYSFESYHRIQQTSVRAVWQLLDNTWVHPYLNGGFLFEHERRRYHVPEQFFRPPPDPRGTTPTLPPMVRPESSGQMTKHRGGATVGGGAKFYVSANAYINTGLQVSYAKPTTTVSLLAGFGFDF